MRITKISRYSYDLYFGQFWTTGHPGLTNAIGKEGDEVSQLSVEINSPNTLPSFWCITLGRDRASNLKGYSTPFLNREDCLIAWRTSEVQPERHTIWGSVVRMEINWDKSNSWLGPGSEVKGYLFNCTLIRLLIPNGQDALGSVWLKF